MKLRILILLLSATLLTACEGVEYGPNNSYDQQEFAYDAETLVDTALELATSSISKEKGAEVLLDYACEQSELLCLQDTSTLTDLIPVDSEIEYLSNYDADTVKFKIYDKETGTESIATVRVLLIDGTEIKGEDGRPEPLAKEGQQEAERILKAAKSIRLEYDQGDTKDRYNRHLMHIFLDDKNFQEMMLKTGLVKIAYVFEPNTTYLNQLKKAEKFAKKNKLGLWSDKYVQ
ncbi:thermonuclease family protein [Solibacillus sp. FSL K6-1554]|uniref:thermonuclease family protein n=1 Tax=Solibacillus sp. FSL K6-1554 TaxID=2921472 RepID=UPI0030F961F5